MTELKISIIWYISVRNAQFMTSSSPVKAGWDKDKVAVEKRKRLAGPGILPEARGETLKPTRRKVFVVINKNGALWPSNSVACLAIAKHLTNSRTASRQRCTAATASCCGMLPSSRSWKACEGECKKRSPKIIWLPLTRELRLGGKIWLKKTKMQTYRKSY